MDKVYCEDCEFLKENQEFIEDSACTHLNNFRDNWYEPDGQHETSPTILNIDNDCKWFKEN